MKVAVRAFDAESVRLERGEVRAACQEDDVGAGGSEASAEIAAEAAAADDRDAHAAFYSPAANQPGPRRDMVLTPTGHCPW